MQSQTESEGFCIEHWNTDETWQFTIIRRIDDKENADEPLWELKKIKANFLIKPGRKGKFLHTEDNESFPFRSKQDTQRSYRGDPFTLRGLVRV